MLTLDTDVHLNNIYDFWEKFIILVLTLYEYYKKFNHAIENKENNFEMIKTTKIYDPVMLCKKHDF